MFKSVKTDFRNIIGKLIRYTGYVDVKKDISQSDRMEDYNEILVNEDMCSYSKYTQHKSPLYVDIY